MPLEQAVAHALSEGGAKFTGAGVYGVRQLAWGSLMQLKLGQEIR